MWPGIVMLVMQLGQSCGVAPQLPPVFAERLYKRDISLRCDVFAVWETFHAYFVGCEAKQQASFCLSFLVAQPSIASLVRKPSICSLVWEALGRSRTPIHLPLHTHEILEVPTCPTRPEYPGLLSPAVACCSQLDCEALIPSTTSAFSSPV